MVDRDDMTAEMDAKRAIEIAADICVYTNKNIITEKIKNK
jgi:ATP-dependent protease HslVU (ClpYQ) peptidase subunit